MLIMVLLKNIKNVIYVKKQEEDTVNLNVPDVEPFGDLGIKDILY